MNISEQTFQQIDRAIRKIAEKYPAPKEASLMTDIHIRVTQETGEMVAYNDDDAEINRCVIEQWINNSDDNFYDQIRVKCLNTFLRHYQANKDGNTLCLMENMLLCEVLHRMASIAGNESLATCAQLSYDYFIHPRLLDKE